MSAPDSSKDSSKPWKGRFEQSTDPLVETYTASLDADRRLYKHDIQGSVAHATMLAEVGVLSAAERDAIIAGLRAIEADIEADRFAWSVTLEDVHMNIEAALTQRVGEVGKKLHTGRSRNDQVATDLRLMLRAETDALLADLRSLQHALVDMAEREADTVMPGFTHLQPAQPVTFGHHLLAWVAMLERDGERFIEGRRRINRSPLGAAALAGTGFPVDRAMTARLLGFEAVCENSLDAVSDRDFLIEFVADCALLMTHISRIAEELVLWSSPAFGFIELDDAHCTGSSIMPQKKNPDVPELARGKAGRVAGHLVSLLMLMKGQPLAYNRDNQEDKVPVFDTIDTVRPSLRVLAALVPAMRVHRERMREAAGRGYTTATDLADYLVRKGLPFRDAHEVVGRAVRHAIDIGRDLGELELSELRRFSEAIGADVYAVLTLEGSVAARDHVGGTAPAQVRAAVARARRRLSGGTEN
ncbi:MAG: argininosuccinate lyase [Gammaproteobacteria bacterium]|nr:argininosuccinate lyase [Gammaproteobacteria bacterium]NIR85549.1 argininosuccinate lyase [Gammaproteobacteria bacterium]NIR89808.1 argininosuccinate lyase [Gammaproteobacteria bacterium]NIU06684.1 argininosuccinate lyase [Gammaproteobacteria bacterium]NIV75075.1 argininosuccinate lyase [Gammaproteobacteria bacterium]